MATRNKQVMDLEIISDNLCLNFVNTVDWHASEHPVEYLKIPQDLVLWGSHVGLLGKQQVNKLLETVNEKQDKSVTSFKKALQLREAMYRILTLFITEKPIHKQDLTLFNAHLANTMKYARIKRTAEGFILSFPEPEKDLEYLLHPVVQAAADLFTSKTLNRVKKCDDPLCGWFFIDTSKNKSRRWCSMKDCGNRAKARRFYEKRRAQKVVIV